MSKPRISFVMPTYNRLEWIGESLQSLVEQTEKDIEIIVVDDCSDDGTKEFLDEWAMQDPRIKVFHNAINQGGGNSRNIGASLATSEIIAVCDDDDTYPNDRAEIILRWFAENPESELVNFPYVRIDYFGDIMPPPFWGAQFDEAAFKENGAVNYFCNPSVAYKKKSADEIGGYQPENKDQTDDIQFLTNWIKAGKKVGFDNRAFGVKHRVLPDSMMSKQRGFRAEWAVSK